MRKRLINAGIVVCLAVILICLVNLRLITDIVDPNIPLGDGYVEEKYCDENIIPDKYNCGVMVSKEEMITAVPGNSYCGVFFKDGGNNIIKLDLAYSNKNIQGNVEINNIDFSNCSIQTINENAVNRKVNLIFNNCIFGKITTGRAEGNVTYSFNNCNIKQLYGSNASFDRCIFGHSCSDALNPFVNVSVKNSYFMDMSYNNEEEEIHTDGVQIYGYSGIDAHDIYFENCRFEIPRLVFPNSKTGVNACIMLQLEKSNGYDINFSNCYLNGGGFSVYAWAKTAGCSLKNVKFSNIYVGAAGLYGKLYPKVADTVTFDNFTETNNLYVSTVSKNEAKKETYLVVSNDTNKKRNFRVYTSSGKKYDFSIDACPNSANISSNYKFDDFPFDRKYTIPENCDWLVCYDVQKVDEEEYLKQIRFKNWTDESVKTGVVEREYIESSNEDKQEDVVENAEIVAEGTCGTNIEWAIDKNGEVSIEGQGATKNYNSKSTSPFLEYKSDISEVEIEGGITVVGSQLFKNCTRIEKVEMADGVKEIRSNAFAGCKGLEEVYLPNTIREIGDYSFHGTSIKTVYFDGTDSEWDDVNVHNYNAPLQNATIITNSTVIETGKCGNNVKWSLTAAGKLIISGTGGTVNYTSTSVAPWTEYISEIKEIVIEDGVTSLGNQMFRNCNMVSSVELPNSIATIGKNTFIGCKQIGNVKYKGTEAEWSQINIGVSNECLTNAKIVFSK